MSAKVLKVEQYNRFYSFDSQIFTYGEDSPGTLRCEITGTDILLDDYA
jgi:hypothetical protein